MAGGHSIIGMNGVISDQWLCLWFDYDIDLSVKTAWDVMDDGCAQLVLLLTLVDEISNFGTFSVFDQH